MTKQLSTTHVEVTDVLSHMCNVHALFKIVTNFEVYSFDELTSFVCPIIRNNACSMGIESIMNGMPMKLTHEQLLLNFIIYLIVWNHKISSFIKIIGGILIRVQKP